MMPEISIIMATYNRAHLIKETLESLSNQTFKDWECLIIDDGSLDNTSEILRTFLHDKRIKYFCRDKRYKKGLPGCRNYGLDLAKGKYIVFFDDDDIIHPENLSYSLEVLQKNNCDFCHFQKKSFINSCPEFSKRPIKEMIGIIDSKNIFEIVTQKIGLASCTVLWKSVCFDGVRFKEDLLYAEEWECYLRIISNGKKGISTNRVLYYNRKHENSNTSEFYRKNKVREDSFFKAICLIIDNLNEKKMLDSKILSYFIQKSLNFKDEKLFDRILRAAKLKGFNKFYWESYYRILPFKLFLYRRKKIIFDAMRKNK